MNEHRVYIDDQIEQNKYNDPNYSLSRVAFGTMVYQPIAESYIKNAYSRNTGSAMYNAVNNGGFYSQYTFIGGNTIFGGEGSVLKKIPGLKKFYSNNDIVGHRELFNIKNKLSFNYIDPKKNETSYVTSGGIKNPNDMLESGFGFGKKYNFTDKDRFLYNNFYGKNKINSSTNVEEVMSSKIYERIKSENYIDDYIINKTKDIDTFNQRVNNFFKYTKNDKKINKEKAFLLTKGILNEDELKSIDFSKASSKEQLMNIVKEKRNIVNGNSNMSLYDLFKDHDEYKSRVRNIETIIGDSKELNQNQILDLLDGAFANSIEKNELEKIFKKRGIEGLKESVVRALNYDTLEEVIASNVKPTAEKITKIAKTNKFAGVVDTILGNKAGMFLTGAVGGPIGVAIQVALGVASAISVAHQEKSINDFVSDRLSNYNDYDFIESEYGERSIASNYSINNSNYQDYQNIVANRNISKNALREIDPINIDSQLSDSKNFTIF